MVSLNKPWPVLTAAYHLADYCHTCVTELAIVYIFKLTMATSNSSLHLLYNYAFILGCMLVVTSIDLLSHDHENKKRNKYKSNLYSIVNRTHLVYCSP